MEPPIKPTLSYRIWFSQRNGSTVLSKLLEDTGILGRPKELFNKDPESSLLEIYKVKDYASLRNHLWQEGTSKNGVFAIKHSRTYMRSQSIVDELKELQGLDPESSEEVVYKDLFPYCKHIYLTRRNRIRQAVSWWKAIQDNQWHLTKNSEIHPLITEDAYDYDAIHHLYREISLRECAMEDYFTKFQIVPLTLVYEDMVQDFEITIKKIAQFLGVPLHHEFTLPELYYKKVANDVSESWVQRFRKELQEELGNITW